MRGGQPEWHIQADALEVAKMAWDMVIAFPPCTHLSSSGARWFPEKRRDGRQLMRDFARLADWQNAVFAEFGRAARDRGDYRNADKVKGMLGSEIKSRL